MDEPDDPLVAQLERLREEVAMAIRDGNNSGQQL